MRSPGHVVGLNRDIRVREPKHDVSSPLIFGAGGQQSGALGWSRHESLDPIVIRSK